MSDSDDMPVGKCDAWTRLYVHTGHKGILCGTEHCQAGKTYMYSTITVDLGILLERPLMTNFGTELLKMDNSINNSGGANRVTEISNIRETLG